MIAFRYFNRGRSLPATLRSMPTSLSSSARRVSAMLGSARMCAIAHSTVVICVSVPPANASCVGRWTQERVRGMGNDSEQMVSGMK